MKKRKPFLSVIIPLFNEESRIFNLAEIQKYLEKKGFSHEIILVNDGSSDKTLSVLKKYINKNQSKVITYSKNRGKGYAIKLGMLASKGKYKFFTDIDL